MVELRVGRIRRLVLVAAIVSAGLAALAPAPASAAVTAVKGSACGYITNLGLFGGPQQLKGCGQTIPPGTAGSASPSVTLPSPNGSATPITASDSDGAMAQYGPAVIFGGIWPVDVATGPPSGPISVSTQGTPAGGTVTSSADIVLHQTPVPVRCFGDPAGTTNCSSPGGFGPFPVEGDELHVSCTATENSVTGTTSFVNGILTTSTDGAGEPVDQEPIPDNPPPNYTRHGVITNVGDVFSVVFNEQIPNPDGSLTVNAVHMYLFGTVAVGEIIKGQATCGTTPSGLSSADRVAPTCGLPFIVLDGPEGQPVEPQQQTIGVFDARGLQSISNIVTTNATVQVGADADGVDPNDPNDDPEPYLVFTPGQTGPLVITGTRVNSALPMAFSFTAVDAAGNATHCNVGSTTTYYSINDVSVNEGNAGTTNASFTITRSGNTTGASSVKYRTNGGTATAGTDYTAVPLTVLNFAAGETTKTVNVSIIGDGSIEANETFNVQLSAQSAGGVIADTSGTGTIVHDDGTAYISVNNVTVTEGNAGTTPATFTITRSGNTTGTSSVKYTTSGGSAIAGTDYTAVPLTTVTFAAGETSKVVNVNVTGDTTDEVNETFNLALSGQVGATLSDNSGAATIVDDEGAITAGPATWYSINDVSVNEGNAGTSNASFTITRSGNTTGASSVKYRTNGGTATAGTDYTAVPLTVLNFAAGETTKTVNVSIIGDGLVEANETFNVQLSAQSAGTAIADTSGTGTIVHDDGTAYLSVNSLSVTEGNSGPVTATFVITRSGNTTGTSSVKYTTSGGNATAGTDYTAVPLTTVTFAAGETSKTVNVNVTGDTTDEVNETFNLALSGQVGATLSDNSGGATILDND